MCSCYLCNENLETWVRSGQKGRRMCGVGVIWEVNGGKGVKRDQITLYTGMKFSHNKNLKRKVSKRIIILLSNDFN